MKGAHMLSCAAVRNRDQNARTTLKKWKVECAHMETPLLHPQDRVMVVVVLTLLGALMNRVRGTRSEEYCWLRNEVPASAIKRLAVAAMTTLRARVERKSSATRRRQQLGLHGVEAVRERYPALVLLSGFSF